MKKILVISVMGAALFLVSCAKDYSKDLVGKWNAGKASFNNNDLLVTIRPDNTLVAEITNADIKPVHATYTLNKEKFVIKFTKFDLSYKIIKMEKDVLVMNSRYGRITWNRLK